MCFSKFLEREDIGSDNALMHLMSASLKWYGNMKYARLRWLVTVIKMSKMHAISKGPVSHTKTGNILILLNLNFPLWLKIKNQ